MHAALLTAMLFQSALAHVAPAPSVRLLDWNRAYIQNENGRPYDHDAYPHLGAPGGPCDAFDDPRVNLIPLQFASRLGKTFFGQCACLHTSDVSPAPMMFVSSTEKVASDVVARTYTLATCCPRTVDKLLREDRRRADCMQLGAAKMFVGWARSVSTLADKNVKIGHGNELDKWERLKTSTEGDPLDLFLDRSKDFPNYKYILESTPTVRGESRIERLLLQSSYNRYYVPCPHCKKYQTLKFPRLTWDKTKAGNHDVDLAEKTARYTCEHCLEACLDHHRAWMMRMGVWLADGCDIDHEKALAVAIERRAAMADGTFSEAPVRHYLDQDYVVGTPNRDGISAGYQLSSLYALSLTWGKIAAKWVSVYQIPFSLWNFVNQWLGETWEKNTRREDWEAVAERLIVGVGRKRLPVWASLVTMGIDRQIDHYKWLVEAWGDDDQSHVVDYGADEDLEMILQAIILADWKYEDRVTNRQVATGLKIARTLIDCGFKPKEPSDLSRRCLEGNPRVTVLCCRGASTRLYAPYRIATMTKDMPNPGQPLVWIDGDWTQSEIEAQLHDRRPGLPGGTSVFQGDVADHSDFFRELLNEEPATKIDRNNKDKTSWDRITTSHPNDWRDAKRYSYTGKLIWTDNGRIKVPPRDQGIQKATPIPTSVTRNVFTPDGRAYLPTER